MVLEGASTSPFVCAALRVGRGRRQTVQLFEVWEGLSAFLGKLVTDLSASRSATNYSQICRLDGWRTALAESIALDLWEWHKTDDVTHILLRFPVF
jgi:hypothetical protein